MAIERHAGATVGSRLKVIAPDCAPSASRHRFTLFRGDEGCWALTQLDADFGMVFHDLASALDFAAKFCHGEEATIALKDGIEGLVLSCPLKQLLALPHARLLGLLATRFPERSES